jgi:hypothetical protein
MNLNLIATSQETNINLAKIKLIKIGNQIKIIPVIRQITMPNSITTTTTTGVIKSIIDTKLRAFPT